MSYINCEFRQRVVAWLDMQILNVKTRDVRPQLHHRCNYLSLVI